MNTSGCREGIEETPSGIEETPRGINGKTTVFWIGIIAGPKAQGRHWKKLYLLHVGNTFLDVKKCKAQGKNGRHHSLGLKIASPKVQGRHIENCKPKGPRKAYLGELHPSYSPVLLLESQAHRSK